MLLPPYGDDAMCHNLMKMAEPNLNCYTIEGLEWENKHKLLELFRSFTRCHHL